jgi:hypothetical protein
MGAYVVRHIVLLLYCLFEETFAGLIAFLAGPIAAFCLFPYKREVTTQALREWLALVSGWPVISST